MEMATDRTGKKALEFVLEDMQGRMHKLKDYLGGWTLLVFHRHLG